VVNSPTTHGSVGLSTGLDPAMTLGCGGYGGNITSDNISPRHLLNIKRLAYEVSPVVSRWDRIGARTGDGAVSAPTPSLSGSGRLPSAPERPLPPVGISADSLSRRIDEFLGSRGFKAQTEVRPGAVPASASPLDFVCEEDVRLAIQAGRTLVVSERAIVTPAARDLGEQHRIFRVAPWSG
jgi:acetaldehyde dehydrogenase (acetylating)